MSKEKLSTLVAKLDELTSCLSTLPEDADDGVPADALMAAVSFFSVQCKEIADELREQLSAQTPQPSNN
jgi:hypothetical protein